MTKWQARPHQIQIASEALPILKEYGLVYLAMEERTGKSITALLMAEACKEVRHVLIITTKKALEGWQETLEKFPHTTACTLVNYHSAHKAKGKFQLAILDEAHKYISGYPKTSKLWSYVFHLVYGLPIIYCSATPHAQGPQLLVNQFKLSKWNPWANFKDFYAWFKHYAQRDKEGNLPTTKISPTQTVIDYSKIRTKEALDSVKHLFVTYTRQELGFEQEPEDVLHFIELKQKTKDIYNIIAKDKVVAFTHSESGRDYNLVCDSSAKLRWALHMLEGGVLKIDDEHINLGNNEKVEYILKTWGDSADLAIMYHFKADAIKLGRYFKNAGLFQASSYAEGVDLSHYKHLVIYSQNHSTAQHTQRRARQANMNRKEEIKVHYLLVKGAASHKAYKAVSINKVNFVDTVFERI
jgi:hypothetical protein